MADRQQQIADADERDRRDDIRTELGDRRDALRDQLDLEMQALDARREQLDAEFEAVQELFEERLRNANLYAEARLLLERGVNEQLIQDLWAYEKEFGEGMGILGDYVKTRLTQQILIAGEALQNLAHNVRIATDQNLFERVLNGENLTIRDVFSEMFNTTRLDEIINKINHAIESIDIEHIKNKMRILGDEFNRLVNGNFNINERGHVSGDLLRNANWDFAGGTTTAFGDIFQVLDAEGNQLTIKVTPVLEGENQVLTPSQLRQYVSDVLSGAENLLEADNANLIIAIAPGWDEDAFDDMNARLEYIRQQHTNLWLTMQENIDRFIQMSDEGLFSFIQQQFGTIPIFAKEAIAEALRELGSGQVSMEEALKTIFNLPIENANAVLASNLNNLTQEQVNVIEQMKQNSIAWEQATTEAERARLEAENERLALAQGWFKDKQVGTWYLDENKTQVLFEMIDKIKNAQIDKIETLIEMYDEDYRKFNEAQQRKLLSVRRLHDEVTRSSGEMFNVLSSNMSRWVGNVESVLNQIGQAIHQLTAQLNAITQMAAQAQASLSSANPNVSVQTNLVPVPRFASGGLNRGAGLRFLDPDEQVLTAEQTKAFSELVFGLGSDGMRDITDSIRKANNPSANIQNRSLLEANFNFNAGVTQEALPEVKRMLNSAIHELKGEIPAIVATEQRDSIRRMGGR